MLLFILYDLKAGEIHRYGRNGR